MYRIYSSLRNSANKGIIKGNNSERTFFNLLSANGLNLSETKRGIKKYIKKS